MNIKNSNRVANLLTEYLKDARLNEYQVFHLGLAATAVMCMNGEVVLSNLDSVEQSMRNELDRLKWLIRDVRGVINDDEEEENREAQTSNRSY